MSRGSRSSLRRRERRAVIETKTEGLSARDTLDMADALDLPDGAAFAYAMEVSGLWTMTTSSTSWRWGGDDHG